MELHELAPRHRFDSHKPAYALAVAWKVTDNATYADSAGAILDGWSGALKEVTGSSDKFLASGIYGYQLANAAELLRKELSKPGYVPAPIALGINTDGWQPIERAHGISRACSTSSRARSTTPPSTS